MGTETPWHRLYLSRVWLLSDYLGNSRLCNDVIDYWLKERDDRSPLSDRWLTYIWEQAPPDSVLRVLLVDTTTSTATSEWLDAQPPRNIPYQLLLEVARACASRHKWHCPTYSERCRYHIHAGGEALCKNSSTTLRLKGVERELRLAVT